MKKAEQLTDLDGFSKDGKIIGEVNLKSKL